MAVLKGEKLTIEITGNNTFCTKIFLDGKQLPRIEKVSLNADLTQFETQLEMSRIESYVSDGHGNVGIGQTSVPLTIEFVKKEKRKRKRWKSKLKFITK
jgi:hypothetical protein